MQCKTQVYTKTQVQDEFHDIMKCLVLTDEASRRVQVLTPIVGECLMTCATGGTTCSIRLIHRHRLKSNNNQIKQHCSYQGLSPSGYENQSTALKFVLISVKNTITTSPRL